MKRRKCDMCGIETTLDVPNNQNTEDRLWKRMWASSTDVVTGETLIICVNCKRLLEHADGNGILTGEFVLQ